MRARPLRKIIRRGRAFVVIGAGLLPTLMAQTVPAAAFNPFLGETPAVKKVDVARPAEPKPSTPQVPVPLPVPPPQGFNPQYPPRDMPRGDDVGATGKADKTPIKIAGRIGDQVTIVNSHGEKTVVPDGTERAGCLVAYPEVICDKAEIGAAKRRIAAAARVRQEEEAALSAQKAKVVELQGSIGELRKQLNEAFAETAKHKSEVARLTAENGRLAKLPADIEALNRKLAAAAVDAGKLKAEIATLKVSQSAPPEWVKGAAREYKDDSLGKITIHRDGQEVTFCIANGQAIAADAVFGKNVIRKERRGEFTYYALNAKTVKFKEPLP